jgi:hypothetical protein
MDGLTNGGGAQHHFIQPEPALSLSKNSAPNTLDPLFSLWCYVRIPFGGFDTVVPPQFLDVPQPHAAFMQMGRKRMA